MKKTISIICVVALLLLTLTSCGVQLDDLVGTWNSSYYYNGNQINCTFYIDADGTYGEVTFRNGILSSTEKGVVEIEGNTVNLRKERTTIRTVFTYKDGKLLNGDHVYTKSE